MNILHTVESYLPSINGMQEVVQQISENLVMLGNNVTIATSKNINRKENLINGVKIIEFDISGNFINGLKGKIQEYEDFLLNSDYDIIANFAAQQWATDIMLPLLEKIKSKKVFIPTGFSGLYLLRYKQYFENMKIWMKKYDMNIFLSEDYRDINFAKKNGITKITIIPNGASEKEFFSKNNINLKKKLGIPDNNFLILNVSSHTGLKGHMAALKIFNRSKIKNSTFLIIGNSIEKSIKTFSIKIFIKKILFIILKKDIYNGCFRQCNDFKIKFNKSRKRIFDKKTIIIEKLTREETISAYKISDLFLFTSNVECSPIVLFECMASKTPFLTCDVGNSREIITWSNSGILLPTVKNKNGLSFVDINKSKKILENIYNCTNIRNELSRNGYKAWEDKFSWEKIASDYNKLYTKLLEI